MSWYLQSASDHDTHRGELRPDGTVAARCGIEFVPKELPFDRIALPGHPQDSDQICPDCQRNGVSGEPEHVAVADLTRRLTRGEQLREQQSRSLRRGGVDRDRRIPVFDQARGVGRFLGIQQEPPPIFQARACV